MGALSTPHADRDVGVNAAKRWVAENTNPDCERGALKKVIRGADMFLGVSVPGVLSRSDVKNMQKDVATAVARAAHETGVAQRVPKGSSAFGA